MGKEGKDRMEKSTRFCDESMPVFCWDRTEENRGYSVIWRGGRLISAGTTVYSMSKEYRDAEYERYARDYGIHFIFEDRLPTIDFYMVPWVDIFAEDGIGGYLGKVLGLQDGESICYIDKDRNCFLAAEDMESFLEKAPVWKQELKPMEQIKIYASKAEAEKEYEFWQEEELLKE